MHPAQPRFARLGGVHNKANQSKVPNDLAQPKRVVTFADIADRAQTKLNSSVRKPKNTCQGRE